MSDKRSIEAAFARANVPLEVTNRSLNRQVIRGGGQMVQMDIASTSMGETIRMNIPDGADVRTLGEDRDHQQVVVMIDEPEREFVEQFWNRSTHKMDERTRKVPGDKRRFLVGMDECHLFIAQLTTNCTSVKQAHEGLRPKEVPKGRKAKKLKVKRSGEWFLAPASPQEIKEIEDHIKQFGVRKKVGIGTSNGRSMRGRPHIVSESVVIGRKIDHDGTTKGRHRAIVVQGDTEFVRGRIIHPDHKVVKLKTWHKVRRNLENRAAGARWVD
jgi:hypothetical protein